MHEQRDEGEAVAREPAAARALPPADLALVVVCWLLLGTASLLVALLPSRRVLRTLGPSIGAVAHAPTPALDPRQRGRAQRIARAVNIAARRAPFRADCYPQALTAARLCRWFGVPHALQLGARFAATGAGSDGRLEGHAWVTAAGLTICGGAASGLEFGTVACFVHLPRAVAGDARG